MNTILKQKFKITADVNVQTISAPTPYAFNQQLKIANGKSIFIVFVQSQQEVKLAAKFIQPTLQDEAILWCVYPKKTSGIKTDINRDTGWDLLTGKGLEIVSALSVDAPWSALRFKSKDSMKTNLRDQPKVEFTMPLQLEALLIKNLKAKVFFETLSYTNRKEYALWISSAKREATLEKRLNDTLDKLLSGKKNPSEK